VKTLDHNIRWLQRLLIVAQKLVDLVEAEIHSFMGLLVHRKN
jgi:hypothetical protein